MPNKDYYEILGVSDTTSQDEIKKVYRDLAKKYHPDANKGDKQAESRFKEISEAYHVLRDPEKRKKYDQMRKYGFSGGQPGGFDFQGFDFGQFSQQGYGGRRSGGGGGGSIFDELFGVGGMGHIFGDMFDQGTRTRRDSSRAQQQSGDLHTELTIPFSLAVSGGKQTVSITVDGKCDSCNGSGAAKGANPQTCHQCNGRGTISMSQGFFAVNRTCPRCMGRGIIIDKPCKVCNGTGDVKKTKRLSVSIPKGVENGALLRLKGMGNNGSKKRGRGDLIIKIFVSPHRFFKRKGDDVYCEIPLDIIKAIKGAKIRVKTVYNKKVELTIPPKTKDGRTFRMKGLGISSKRGTGDQYVTINVLSRNNFTEEEQKIIEEFENNGKM